MNGDWMKKKWVWIPAALVAVSLGTAPLWWPDDLEDKHGRTPQQLPVITENALLQEDGATLKKIGTPAYLKEITEVNEIPLQQSKKNERNISPWTMQEYKLDEETFLYHIQWVTDFHVRTGGFYKVKKMNDEWRIERVPSSKFDLMVQGIEPTIIREGDNDS